MLKILMDPDSFYLKYLFTETLLRIAQSFLSLKEHFKPRNHSVLSTERLRMELFLKVKKNMRD